MIVLEYRYRYTSLVCKIPLGSLKKYTCTLVCLMSDGYCSDTEIGAKMSNEKSISGGTKRAILAENDPLWNQIA